MIMVTVQIEPAQRFQAVVESLGDRGWDVVSWGGDRFGVREYSVVQSGDGVNAFITLQCAEDDGGEVWALEVDFERNDEGWLYRHQVDQGHSEKLLSDDEALRLYDDTISRLPALLSSARQRARETHSERNDSEPGLQVSRVTRSDDELKEVDRPDGIYLPSVNVAHELATALQASGRPRDAARVLGYVALGNLPGDSDDFHNSFVVALALKDPVLANSIAESGLQQFPANADLVADKAAALVTSGQYRDALELLEAFRAAHPDIFARSWRPVMTYADAALSGEVSEQQITRLREAFESVVVSRPDFAKAWSRYARMELELGRLDVAEQLLRRALESNPYVQELNMVLGELLLASGRAEEAVAILESALRVDFHETFQHGVNQFSVRAHLAQAYEATGDLDKAILFYRSMLSIGDEGISRTIKRYALSRLDALALLKGSLPTELLTDVERSAYDALRDLAQEDIRRP